MIIRRLAGDPLVQKIRLPAKWGSTLGHMVGEPFPHVAGARVKKSMPKESEKEAGGWGRGQRIRNHRKAGPDNTFLHTCSHERAHTRSSTAKSVSTPATAKNAGLKPYAGNVLIRKSTRHTNHIISLKRY